MTNTISSPSSLSLRMRRNRCSPVFLSFSRSLHRAHRGQLEHREAVLPRQDRRPRRPRAARRRFRRNGQSAGSGAFAFARLLDRRDDGRRDDVVEALRPLRESTLCAFAMKTVATPSRSDRTRNALDNPGSFPRGRGRSSSSFFQMREPEAPERLEVGLDPVDALHLGSVVAFRTSLPPCASSRSCHEAKRARSSDVGGEAGRRRHRRLIVKNGIGDRFPSRSSGEYPVASRLPRSASGMNGVVLDRPAVRGCSSGRTRRTASPDAEATTSPGARSRGSSTGSAVSGA